MSMANPPDVSDQRPVSLYQLFAAFTSIALSSFGGGLSGWIHRDVVERRGWLSETEFLTGLSLAQAMPGVNVVNISLWVGFQVRGALGAFAAVAGIMAAPFALIIALGTGYAAFRDSPHLHHFLVGVATAGIGFSLNLGLKTTRRATVDLFSGAIVAFLFVSIVILRWPLLPMVLVLVPLGIGRQYWLIRRSHAG